MIFNKHTRMADVVHHNYHTLPIIDRFGIGLGFGDDTIEQVCRKWNVNPDFFVEIINSFLNEEYAADKQLQAFTIKEIVSYLLKSHRYYVTEKVPQIEQLIEQLQWNSNEQAKNRALLKKFFTQYSIELAGHIRHEETEIYPYVVQVEEAVNNHTLTPEVAQHLNDRLIAMYSDHHDSLEEKLLDLKNIIIKYLPQPSNTRICHNILRELFKLEKDLNDHARIEDKVLVPKIKAMEKKLKARLVTKDK